LRDFFFAKHFQSQTVIKEKLRKAHSYIRFAHKMLMKLPSLINFINILPEASRRSQKLKKDSQVVSLPILRFWDLHVNVDEIDPFPAKIVENSPPLSPLQTPVLKSLLEAHIWLSVMMMGGWDGGARSLHSWDQFCSSSKYGK
jgi:hypothetical protein